MAVRRCGHCRGYFKEMWYVSSIEAFCSEECTLAKGRKRSALVRSSNSDEIPPAVRQLVLKRDRSCQLCGSTRSLHVHHIYYRSEAPAQWRHDPSNLIVLCLEDHDLVHSNKRKFQRHLLDLMAKRGYSLNYDQAEEAGHPMKEQG
jgi:5-methylcytosine-specific restriction endonuclease McrA